MKQTFAQAPLLHTCALAGQFPGSVPSGSLDHAVVEVDGVHTWHAFAGFIVFDG
jgi:hypothetical protein